LTQLHTDSYTLSGDPWEKAWEYYLYGPLVKEYKMKGDIDFYLFLYSDQEREVDIKILMTVLDEGGETDLKFSSQFKNVDIGDESPESPLILSTYVNKSIKFRKGHSIVVEILFSEEAGASFYLDYGSQSKHSKIDFPGMVMPESIMLMLLIAPMIPIAVLKFRRRRELGVE
jgi:hypothetical protein